MPVLETVKYMYNGHCSLTTFQPGHQTRSIEMDIRDLTGRPMNQPSPSIDDMPPGVTARGLDPAELALRASEKHFRHMLDNVHLIVVMLDPTGTITYINDHCSRVTGWQLEEVLGCNWFDLFIAPGEPVRDVFDAFVHSGDIAPHYTNDIVTRNGRRRTIAWSNTILRGDQGQVIGTTSIGEDITERLQFEVQLRDSEEKYSKLFHQSNDAIIIHEMDGRILDVNEQAIIQWGYSRDEMLTLTVADLHPLASRGDGLPRIAHAGELRAVRYDSECMRKNGDVFLAEISANRFEWSGRQIAQKIVRDITTRKLSERAVVAARDEALETSRVKSEFLATMSHEIRTPLNGIIGMAELLRDSTLDNEQREFVSIIFSEAEALLGVINDILDFSKIEAGHVKLKPSNFDLTQVVEAVAELLAPKARQHRLSLVTYVSPDMPALLVGDAGRLRQILLNLLGNAVKFTPAGEVVVRAEVDACSASQITVRFTVADTGIGISANDRDRLFQPFTQADGSLSRRYGGTGLGLAISKRLVELMGGSIGVSSAGIAGQGSTFWFTADFHQAPHAPGRRQRTLPGAQRALIASSSRGQREVLSNYLHAWGVTVDTVVHAEAALDLLRHAQESQVYDIVFIDADLPDIANHKFGQLDPRVPDPTPVHLVLLTALNDLHRDEMVAALGFSAHLTKPVKQARLFHTMWQLVTAPPASESDRRPLTTLPEFSPMSGKKVLLVEDNEINRTLVVRQLTRLGLAVEVAATGSMAVKTFTTVRETGRTYDLVFMDVQMPAMDGFQATRLIRQAEFTLGGHVPIVAMTAYASEEDRQLCLAAGMDDYLAKPVTLENMRPVLARWIERGG